MHFFSGLQAPLKLAKREIGRRLKGPSVNVPTFDTQRDLTARQRAHTRCPCTHGKVIGPYHSHEAHKRQIWPRGMAMNEHELTESSIGEGLRSGAHALFVLF